MDQLNAYCKTHAMPAQLQEDLAADGDPCWKWMIKLSELMVKSGQQPEVFEYEDDGSFRPFNPSEQAKLANVYSSGSYIHHGQVGETVVLSATRAVRMTSSWMVLTTQTPNESGTGMNSAQVTVRLQFSDGRPSGLGSPQSLQHVQALVDSVESKTICVEQSFASSSDETDCNLSPGDRVAVLLRRPQSPFNEFHRGRWIFNGVVMHCHPSSTIRVGGFDVVLPDPSSHSAAIDMVRLANIPRLQLFRTAETGHPSATPASPRVAAAIEAARLDEQTARQEPSA